MCIRDSITGTPHEELLAIEERFFRNAMVAMANRYNADLLIEYISIIFDNDDQDHLKSVGTYFFAVIERSSEEIKKVVENLDLTTKNKIMNTLTLLREEGRLMGLLEGIEEGRKEGKQIGIKEGKQQGIKEGKQIGIKETEYKKDVIAIRNMTLKKLEPTVIAEFLSLTIKHVQQIQKELKKETSIFAALAKKQKQSPAQIAKRLKVSEWLVEVLQEVQKKQV